MFLELAEVLDCPDCRGAAGLVAFVGRAEARRVVEGRLGCPLCEIEVPIRRGTMRFDLSSAERRADRAGPPDRGGAASTSPAPSPPAPPRPPPPRAAPSMEAALRIAALLGVSDRAGAVVLLGPGLAAHAAALAGMGDRLEVLAWLEDDPGLSHANIDAPAAGANPLRGAAPDRWPVRSGALHGIALAAPLTLAPDEIVRCIRPGARLVVEGPAATDVRPLLDSGFVELAADARVWVGECR